MKRLIAVLLTLLLMTGASLAALRLPAVQDRLVMMGAKRHFEDHARREALFEKDALQVLVCGSSSPMPQFDRAKACVAVIAGGKFYLVDIGPEATENLSGWLFPLWRVGAVFITHMHSDHIGELGEFSVQSWVNGRDRKLDVYGPPGIERVVAGFNEAYLTDNGYRTAHHGAAFLPPEIAPMVSHPVPMPGEDRGLNDRKIVALQSGDLTVTAIEVNHHEVRPAYAYRFDYRGRSVVISGDTAYHPPLAVAARGADVLLHEADAEHVMKLVHQGTMGMPGLERFNEIHLTANDYHSTPVQAADIANQAGVKLLAMYHLMPPLPSRLAEPIWMRGVSTVRDAGVLVTQDGTLITLPIGSDEVRVGDIED